MAKAKQQPVAEAQEGGIEVGSVVRFLGYAEGTKEEEMILDADGEYTVVALPEGEGAAKALDYIKNYPGITYEEVGSNG